MEIKYTYQFEKQGFQVDQENIRDNYIYLDLGGSLNKNIFDHHTDRLDFSSSAELVYNFPYLIEIDKTKNVNFVVHQYPDFDAVLSVYLVKFYLENNQFNLGVNYLVNMGRKVDSGEFVIDRNNLINPATIMRMINEIDEYSNENKLEKGLILLEMVHTQINEILLQNENSYNDLTKVIDLYNSFLISTPQKFEKEINLAKEDYKKYLKDKKDEIAVPEMVKLYNHEKEKYELVEGLFFSNVPSCKLHKDWARSDHEAKNKEGYVLTFIPLKESTIELSDTYLFYALKEEGKFSEYKDYKAFQSKYSKDEIKKMLNSKSQFFYKKLKNILRKNNLLNEEMSENKNKRFQIIVSVKPNSPYTLEGLGKDLEILEQKKEEKLFKNNDLTKYFKREYFKNKRYVNARFNDKWIKSDDPWYDGRNQYYTIVDTPRRGTYLTYEEVKNTFKKLNYIDVKRNDIKVLIPITFNNKKYTYEKNFKKILKEIRKIEKKGSNKIEIKNVDFGDAESEENLAKNDKTSNIETFINQEVKNKFLPSIQKYMLESESAERNFSYYGQITFDNFEEDFSKTFLKIINSKFDINITNNEMSPPNIYIFRYGVAFITFDFSYKEEDSKSIDFNKLLSVNKKLGSELKDEVESALKVFTDELNFTFDFLEPVFYQFLVLDKYRLLAHSKNSIIYNLTNLLDNFDVDYETSIIQSLTNEISIELNNEVFYGFGKFGGCLIASDSFYDSNSKNKNVPPREDFLGRDFIIFLLTLHQRIFLVKFSDNIDYEDPFYLEKMRANYIDFMKSGWFSEIHKEEIANKIFESWKNIFKTDVLYEEVQEQLNGVNDYRNSILDKKINRLTILFIPITLIGALFDSYFIYTLDSSKNAGEMEAFNGLIPITKFGLLGLILFTTLFVSVIIGYDRIKFYFKRHFTKK